MIDWQNEKVIPLREVPKYVTSRAPGKRVSPSTVWRWALRRQHPLETFATPGGRFTTLEAIGRFIDRISTSKGVGTNVDPLPPDAPRGPERAATVSQSAVQAGDKLKRLIGGQDA